MRIATTLAFAAIGVLGLSLPCAAQSADAVSIAPKTSSKSSSVPKQAAPQRLAPPEAAPAPEPVQAEKGARQDTKSTPINLRPTLTPPQQAAPQQAAVPQQAAPQQVAPQQAVPQQQAVPPQQAIPQQQAIPPQQAMPQQAIPPQQAAVPPQQAAPDYAAPAYAAGAQPQQGAFATPERLLDWMSRYREHPDLWRVPEAVHAMYDYGLFGDEEKEWFCIGFIAGVLGTNPNDGPVLITRMFPLPAKEQEVIIRAIAYSGRPDWRTLLEKNADQMPLRRPLIDDFLNGKRPTLMDLPLDLGGTPGIYALWGYYVATGQHEPVIRIMDALRWSKGDDEAGFFKRIFTGWGSDASDVEKISTGGTAKWTLASYAERDRELIKLYRSEYTRQPPEIADHLQDVIQAAELFESEKIRKSQFGAIEEAQRRQLTAEAGMSKGMTAGSIAIATGCVAATALGQPQIAVPCVIGGALYTGAAKLAR